MSWKTNLPVGTVWQIYVFLKCWKHNGADISIKRLINEIPVKHRFGRLFSLITCQTQHTPVGCASTLKPSVTSVITFLPLSNANWGRRNTLSPCILLFTVMLAFTSFSFISYPVPQMVLSLTSFYFSINIYVPLIVTYVLSLVISNRTISLTLSSVLHNFWVTKC